MTTLGAIYREAVVPADPATAFRLFTEEMHLWVQDTPYTWVDPTRAKAMRLEPGVGGRWLECYDADCAESYEWGRTLVWEPGARVVFTYRHPSLPPEPLTEIEVTFTPRAAGTLVTLEHRGFDKLSAHLMREWAPRAWQLLMRWYTEYVDLSLSHPKES